MPITFEGYIPKKCPECGEETYGNEDKENLCPQCWIKNGKKVKLEVMNKVE